MTFSSGVTPKIDSSGSSNPAFSGSSLAFGIPEIWPSAKPTLADIDGDGDLDLFIGNGSGPTYFVKNTGSSTSPAFSGTSSVYGTPSIGHNASPTFADIDGDGDLDLFVGVGNGNTCFYRNTGSSTKPAFTASSQGFGIPDIGSSATPTFADIDGDGDLDLFIGTSPGNTYFFKNTGLSTNPAFSAASLGFGLPDIGSFASPTFADIDGDGDLDLFIGNRNGDTYYFKNTGSGGVTTTKAAGYYSIGTTIIINVLFSKLVTVNTTGGTPTLLLETGTIDRAATYLSGSGSRTLVFTYIVQAGDTSSDLDINSISSLTLNGSTIKDASGTNAILTLPAPGATGSLAANADLVIDTTAPSAPVLLDLATASDSGISSTDNLTNITAPNITASAEPNVTVVFTTNYGNTSLGSTSTDGSGNASFVTPILSSGTNIITASANDLAGNQSPLSTPVNIIVDTISPRVDVSGSMNPAFAGSSIAFGLPIIGSSSSPTFADIDGDGDPDLFIGSVDGKICFFRNIGNSTSPSFLTSSIAFGVRDVGDGATPTFADFDGDGDLDLFVGSDGGNTTFYRNQGDTFNPTFGAETDIFNQTDIGFTSDPALVDIDGDNDLDLFVGALDGNTYFFMNTGSSGSIKSFMNSSIGFAIPDVGSISSPTFADIDGDGDQDLFIGAGNGNTYFFKNTGTSTAPAFSAHRLLLV